MIPGVHNLVEVRAVAQPAAFMDMMTYTRGDELVFIGIVAIDKKLRHGIAHGCLFDMLPKRPPAVVPHLLEVLVWTVEERYVLRHPFPGLAIRNGLYNVLILHGVEIIDIVLVVGGTEKGTIARR